MVDVATPESDRELCDQAKVCTVRELVEVARTGRAPADSRRPRSDPARSEHDRRYLRFNDTFAP